MLKSIIISGLEAIRLIGERRSARLRAELASYENDYGDQMVRAGEITIRLRELEAKIENGADVVQLFDSWSGVLNREIYNEFFLEPLQRIKASITEVPLIIFLRGSHYLSNELKELNADCLGLDWTIEMKNARRFYGPNQVLQGNLDPCALYAPLSQIEDKAKALVRDAGPRHIFNLGHGVYPDTPLDSVKCLINTVKNISY